MYVWLHLDAEYVVADWLHLDKPESFNNEEFESKDGNIILFDINKIKRKFDVIITNPPFIASGQRNRKYFIDELVLNSHRHLNENGHLIFIHSSMANIIDTLKSLKKNAFNNIEIVSVKSYYWRDLYWQDRTFLNECEQIQKETNGLCYQIENKTQKRVETLFVIKAQLTTFDIPSIAH